MSGSSSDASLTAEQEQQVTALVEACSGLPNHEWATRATCTRYLQARSWNHAKALAMITATLRWRDSTRPDLVRCTKCAADPLSHNLRWVGFDSESRPVAYTCFSQAHDRWDVTVNMAHLTWLLEQMQRRFDAVGTPLQKWVLVVE